MDTLTRREQLEAMLADNPNDEFLRYGLAMEFASAGDHAAAVQQLRDLIALNPTRPYVPAYHMAGQSLVKLGMFADAIALLREGIDKARQQGNDHAASEMQGLVETLE